MQGTRYSRYISVKIAVSRQILENYSNIKFHWNTSSGSRVVTCGQIDGRTDIHKGRQQPLFVSLRTFLIIHLEARISYIKHQFLTYGKFS